MGDTLVSVTQTSKRRVFITSGGRSGEHEVSCVTIAGILKTIDRTKWDVLPVGITHEGGWVLVEDKPSLLEFREGCGQSVQVGTLRVVLAPDSGSLLEVIYEGDPASPESKVTSVRDLGHVDVVFPLLHGPYDEDGTIQGLFEMANVHYVGCGVTSSAISMDKHLMRTVLTAAGIDVGTWELITPMDWEDDPEECARCAGELGCPVFVKPCRAGSSIGITRVDSPQGLATAIKEAQNSDPHVIVEAAISGREIGYGILRGTGMRPRIVPLGEIEVPEGELYDYELKHIGTEAIGLVCPTRVAPEFETQIHWTAAKVFEALEREGFARVDFFHDKEAGTVIINEANTMPGFTPISMYPQMWKAAGMGYAALIDEFLEQALGRDLGLR